MTKLRIFINKRETTQLIPRAKIKKAFVTFISRDNLQRDVR